MPTASPSCVPEPRPACGGIARSILISTGVPRPQAPRSASRCRAARAEFRPRDGIVARHAQGGRGADAVDRQPEAAEAPAEPAGKVEEAQMQPRRRQNANEARRKTGVARHDGACVEPGRDRLRQEQRSRPGVQRYTTRCEPAAVRCRSRASDTSRAPRPSGVQSSTVHSGARSGAPRGSWPGSAVAPVISPRPEVADGAVAAGEDVEGRDLRAVGQDAEIVARIGAVEIGVEAQVLPAALAASRRSAARSASGRPRRARCAGRCRRRCRPRRPAGWCTSGTGARAAARTCSCRRRASACRRTGRRSRSGRPRPRSDSRRSPRRPAAGRGAGRRRARCGAAARSPRPAAPCARPGSRRFRWGTGPGCHAPVGGRNRVSVSRSMTAFHLHEINRLECDVFR